ncbi:MAG: hypoxanthine phosphoribosyltransferase [Vulcanimicrobiota bacterium]
MNEDVEKIVFTTEEIEKKIIGLGNRISKDYQGKNLIMIGVLKGAMFFMADLMRKISIPVIIDFIGVSSYGESSRSSGVVRIIKDLEEHIENSHVLIVEDIIDTGLTLAYLMKTLSLRKPLDVKICVLINKKGRRLQDIPLDYTGFEMDNRFVIGYGLDYKDKYRHLPYICTLREDILKHDMDETAGFH